MDSLIDGFNSRKRHTALWSKQLGIEEIDIEPLEIPVAAGLLQGLRILKTRFGRDWPATRAMHFPASSADPPPTAITPS